MKTKDIINRHLVLAISALLITLWLPSITFAQDFPESGNFAQGAQSWANNCARCHNMRDPQDLRDDQWITTVFHMRVRAGLTGQQTRDILTFLQESNNRFSEDSVGISEAALITTENLSGEEVYNQTCIACHGANGKGTVPGAPDFTRPDGPLSQPDQVLEDHIFNGFKSKGSPMAMPPKGGNSNLKMEDIQSVLQYMRETFTQ
jgi:mono/diheme cytochrome c family protein